MTESLLDVHAHHLPARYVEASIRAGILRPDGMAGWPKWDESAQLALMDRAGIEMALLSVSSPGTHFGDDAAACMLTTETNLESAAIVARHADRFGFLASLPLPDVGGTIREISHARDLGARGFIVLTSSQGVLLADPRLQPVLHALDEVEALVLLHPTSSRGAREGSTVPAPAIEFPFATTQVVAELAARGVIRKYPRIRWIIPHVGAALPVLADRLQLFLRRSDPSESSAALLDDLRELWFDTAGAPFPRALDALVALVGHQHVVFGSDSCWTPPDEVAALAHAMRATRAPGGSKSWAATSRANTDLLLDQYESRR